MNNTKRKSYLTLHIITLLAILLCTLVFIKKSRLHQKANPISSTIKLSKRADSHQAPPVITSTTQQTVTDGDNLTRILQRQNINPKTIHDIIYTTDFKNLLPALQIGDTFHFTYRNHALTSIQFQLNNNKTLYLTYSTINGYQTKIKPTPSTITLELKHGTVTSNFEEAALKAGLNHQLIKQFTKLFQGKINFARNVAPQDRFTVLYQEYRLNGQKDHSGRILMAQYFHHNHPYNAVYFQAPQQKDGYYDWQGNGLEPLFLKAPLHYKRISSKFSYRRLDPILHVYRPHFGVDYAAPTGTPIHSVGDGRIVFKGKDGGYGNAIKIRYGSHFLALYAHMSRFADVQKGQHVKKGQLIGYVGQTGWATGPHLHFGWYVNGTPVDPLKRPTFYNPPIQPKDKAEFYHHLHSLQASWELLKDRQAHALPRAS